MEMRMAGIRPELLRAVDAKDGSTTNGEPVELGGNFIIRIREIVSHMLTQLNRVAGHSRNQIETLKRGYNVTSQDGTQMLKNIGNAAPWLAGAGFISLLVQNGVPNETVKLAAKFLADQGINAVGTLLNSNWQAKQAESQALGGLQLSELNQKNSDGSANSGTKQEILALLNSVIEVLKRASSN